MIHLEPGKEYTRGDGTRALIEGLAKYPQVEGQTVYYSRHGDWFAQDGRFVSFHECHTGDGGKDLVPYLMAATNWRSIQGLASSEEPFQEHA